MAVIKKKLTVKQVLAAQKKDERRRQKILDKEQAKQDASWNRGVAAFKRVEEKRMREDVAARRRGEMAFGKLQIGIMKDKEKQQKADKSATFAKKRFINKIKKRRSKKNWTIFKKALHTLY